MRSQAYRLLKLDVPSTDIHLQLSVLLDRFLSELTAEEAMRCAELYGGYFLPLAMVNDFISFIGVRSAVFIWRTGLSSNRSLQT